MVSPSGRVVIDNQGLFHPLGITFLWALYGQKFERQRIDAHNTFLAPYGYDYRRILGQVKWPGREIDPNWDDYEDILGAAIDGAYDTTGQRTEITLVGGSPDDPMDLCRKVCNVTRNRVEKVIALEMWNESFSTGGDLSVMKEMARYCVANSGIPLIGLSSPGNGNDDALAAAEKEVDVTLRTRHTSRQVGDDGWEMVRQPYDFKDIPGVVDANEPPGPESSGQSLTNPLQLAMMRALGVIEGGALSVLHIGDMVQGIDDPSHGRVADLWNVQNIDQILRTVRSVDPYLPVGVENWVPKTLGHLDQGPHALNPDVAGWNTGTGVNRAYAALSGGDFCEALLGIKDSTLLTLVLPGVASCRVYGFNPLTGKTLDFTIGQGESIVIQGEPDGNSGYLLTTVKA